MIGYMQRFRHDPETGKATYAIVQAEDELASIGMALGAGWAGARSMTATAGPGISLMTEFIGLGYYAEIPAVIFDVERVGPSTGLPTRTAQGDLLTTALLSHGDTRHPMFFPALARRVLHHVHRGVRFRRAVPDPGLRDDRSGPGHEQLDGGRVPLSGEADCTRQGADRRRTWNGWAASRRYRDVDGDGVGYRTLPGTNHPAASYFTRGSGHNEKAQYTEREDDYVNNMDRLAHKFEVMRQHVPAPAVQTVEGRQDRLHRDRHLRLRGARKLRPAARRARHRRQLPARPRRIPFTEEVEDFIRATSASTWWIRTATRSCSA